MEHPLPEKPTAQVIDRQQISVPKKRPLSASLGNAGAPRVPKTAVEKETTRRLIVVLEQACLETYKVSSGSSSTARASASTGANGRPKTANDDKYMLLNADDHVRLLSFCMASEF